MGGYGEFEVREDNKERKCLYQNLLENFELLVD